MPRSKKPTGQTPATTRRAVFKRPYWFDRSRSLCELHGWPRSDAGDGLGLIDRYTAAINRPVGQLDADELETLFSQHTDPHYLVPVALDRLGEGNPTLLRCLLHLDPGFWRDHPHLCAELVKLLDGRIARADDELAPEASAFVQRHQVR